VSGQSELNRFLQTDPRDVGCGEALRLLHVYVELFVEDLTGAEAARQHPGIAAHLLACGPCSQDFDGLFFAIQGSEDGSHKRG
jgi:hypothetical protein